jgi:hypothetical protein
MGVMVALLRSHGATMVERHGRSVPANFGSAAGEAAACRSSVGLTERSDRATLEVRGPRAAVDQALAELAGVGPRAWSARVASGRALVRCEGGDAATCSFALLRPDDASVLDVSADHAAIDLVGPLAGEVLEAAGVDPEREPVVVLHDGGWCIELLVARGQGPALFNRLLDAGAPSEIACVGLDAIEHLAVSEHVDALRRPPAYVAQFG